MLPAAARPFWGPCLRRQGAALRLARQQVPRVCAVRLMRCSSPRMGEALAGAPLDNAPKEYPPKIQQLVQDIASLTLLEISDLNELLKKTLKIQDVGLMPMGGTVPGAAPAAAAPEEAEEDIPRQKERTHFTVRLTEAKPVDKVRLIKEIKNYIQGINLVQVHLQTQQEVKLRMTGMALQVVRSDGVLALYNGLSASLCRQMTYSLTRFAIYESVRDHVTTGSQGPLPFYKKVLLGSISGCIGGFVGTPADMVNVRMQNDVKLEPSQRRNYAHALDGLYRVAREEGLKKLFSGASMAASRGMFVTVGQLSCYDQAKQLVLSTGYLADNIFTHFVASFIAGGCATVLCQPLDVLKTRLMNSKGEYKGVFHCAVETAKLGPLAFYKGLVPAGIRLMPHTVLTFVFLEQLRKHFGLKVLS
uniref:Large ribosomal subunit protein bL12 oligomerization domain-containing protein n=1 Tax=Felis catus TaxID=9685 RepID=A0ABI7ZN58_FELCA